MNKASRIVVGLSGGVDSSATAWLLKQQGYDVVGVFMQNWEDDNDDEFCSIKEDSRDAIAVADVVGIDIELVNFAGEYKDRVFSYFLSEYQAGRTPNPCVVCNTWLKFGKLLDYADSVGADRIATGHYARLLPMPDGFWKNATAPVLVARCLAEGSSVPVMTMTGIFFTLSSR